MQSPPTKQTSDDQASGEQPTLYDADFYAWIQEQATLLSHQQWEQLDLPNLIEEIESLGKQVRAELRNRLKVLIGHLLKWEYQPGKRSRSWFIPIRIQRRDTQEMLEESPNLKPYLQTALQRIYESGKDLAVGETNLPLKTFPEDCPYSLKDIFNDRFFPGEPASDDLME